MEFRFYRPELADTALLSVDGICPKGPNLSHWPGNRTPQSLRHDLSTGILLRFAALPEKEREDFLQGVEIVSNNHYDTDGLLSLWVALNPEKALRLSTPLLKAAEAGDFWVAPTPEAVKFDLIVTAFSEPNISPIGLELWALSSEDRYERAYQVLLSMLPSLLLHVDQYKALWREPFARFEESHEYLYKSGKLRRYEDIDLCVIESDRPLDRRAIQTAAQTDRVLFVQHTPEGNLYHFWYSVSSWFDLVTIHKPKRIPPKNLAKQLNLECPGDSGLWIGGEPDIPITDLFFGEAKEKQKLIEMGGTLLPNPTLTQKVEQVLVAQLRAGLAHG